MNIGLNAAIQGLMTAQRALDVAGHNVANANTEGYSRQRVQLSTTSPMGHSSLHMSWAGPGQVGTGVQVDTIKRVRDQFIDRQVRAETSPLGEAKITADTLRQIEDIFGEPSDRSLGTLTTRFWDSWHELSNNPENAATRLGLREVSANLAAVFQEIHGKLTTLRQDVNDRIETTVNDVNSITRQIATLNNQIKAGLAGGQNPNDLQDQRDLLIEKLSEFVKVDVTETAQGALNVYVGGNPLVAEGHNFDLLAIRQGTQGFVQVQYGPTQVPVNISGGSLKGYLDMRDVALSDTDARGFITQLNQMANGIANQVNNLHRAGFALDGTTTLPFFEEFLGPPAVPIDASNIAVNAAIMADNTNPPGYNLIAAALNDPGSLTGGVGDNGNALAIARLRNAKVMGGGTYTFDDFYKGVLVNVGVQGQEAMRKEATQTMLVASVKERRDSASGVSTDEEMADVIKFQKAYAASARILSTIDEMLETLINVGR
ncbi:Flagellar hook-associated protein 1 [compost metagenome]